MGLWLFATGRYSCRYSLVWQVTVLGKGGEGESYSGSGGFTSHPPGVLGPAAHLGLTELGAPLLMTAQYTSLGTLFQMAHWGTHTVQVGGGRAVPGTPGPSLVSHWAAGVTSGHLVRVKAGTLHLNSTVRPQNAFSCGIWEMSGQDQGKSLLYAP